MNEHEQNLQDQDNGAGGNRAKTGRRNSKTRSLKKESRQMDDSEKSIDIPGDSANSSKARKGQSKTKAVTIDAPQKNESQKIAESPVGSAGNTKASQKQSKIHDRAKEDKAKDSPKEMPQAGESRQNPNSVSSSIGDKETKAVADHAEDQRSTKASIQKNRHYLTAEEDIRLSLIKGIKAEQPEIDNSSDRNIVEPIWNREPEVGDLNSKVEGKRMDLEHMAKNARDLGGAKEPAPDATGIRDEQSQELSEEEKNRRLELVEQVRTQFRAQGSKFHFKDQPQKVAFSDKGSRMVSASNDDRVAKAMATMADAKGWETIKVSGHPDFKREVWMEASLRGIEVRGFQPTEQDLKLLERRLDRNMHNTVEHIESGRERKGPAPSPALESGLTENQQALKDAQTLGHKKSGRTYAGRVQEHGEANFNHDPDEKKNYFVTLATDKGEKTVWGVDLKRAMSEGNVKNGDHIKLDFKGNMPVTVLALARDIGGKIIGKEEVTALRNTWEVQKTDKAKVVEAVASAFIDSKVKDPAQREALKAAVGEHVAMREQLNKVPFVPVYDKSAPARTHEERTGPVIERTSERVR